MEDDERRQDEEEHRGQRVPPPQLDAQVLARQSDDVGEVRHPSATVVVARGWTRSGSCVETTSVRRGERLELAVEKRGSALVERRVRLVEQDHLGVVQKRPAQRETLGHSPRVRRYPLVPSVPQREAFERHADPLAALRHAVQAAEEVEVLDRSQLPIDERLVCEVAEPRAVDVHEELPACRASEPREESKKCGLSAPVRTGHDGEAAAPHHEVDAREDALPPVSLLEPARADHATSTSSATNAKKTMLMTPFSVKKAASSRRRSPGRTIACS